MPVARRHAPHHPPGQHLRRQAVHASVVLADVRREVAVFQPRVLERTGVDRGEFLFPDRPVVAQRRMRMACKGYGIRERFRKESRHLADVVAPVPRTVASVP